MSHETNLSEKGRAAGPVFLGHRGGHGQRSINYTNGRASDQCRLFGLLPNPPSSAELRETRRGPRRLELLAIGTAGPQPGVDRLAGVYLHAVESRRSGQLAGGVEAVQGGDADV